MAGRFEGLTDVEWEIFRNIFPSEEQGEGCRGRPAAPSRNILNSLLYILIVGCRWCDLPRGPQWIIKIARTIADLAESQWILSSHVAEAVQYRRQQYEVR
jgi:transposase